LVYVKGTVSDNGKSVQLNFLVDSRAKSTLLPPKAWKAIGLKPMEPMEFLLADGTPIERQLYECKIRLLQRSRHTPVILGEGADKPLLGVITLEEFGLTLNPFDRTLHPATLEEFGLVLNPFERTLEAARMMLAAAKQEVGLSVAGESAVRIEG